MNMLHAGFLKPGSWSGRIFDGSWSASAAGTLTVREPATGDVLAETGLAGPQEVAAAARAAAAGQKAWTAMLPQARAAILNRAADLLEQNGQELIPWIMRESGSIEAKAGIEIEHGAQFLRHAASLATMPMGLVLPTMDGRSSHARRLPHGVVGVISPYNFPLVLSVRAIAAALAVGNAVVHKPDPRTPISGGIIIARLFEDAGLPAGVLHVLPGGADAGEAMCKDPNIAMISFTGSAAGGSKVGEVCGRHLKKVQLELGGKNVLIVLDDADVDVAASNCAWGAFLHQGQICMATGLVLAHESIVEALAEKIAAKARHLPVGDPASGRVALGPVISPNQVETIQHIVDDAVAKGARLLAGGKADGLFYPATVLAGITPEMLAFREELFGPVACIMSFASDAEAVRIAQDDDYGLSAGILSASTSRAMAIGNQLRTGMLHINDQTVNGGPFAPFGGFGKSGNGTRIGGPADIEEFTQWQWVTVRDQAQPYPF
ncbi:Benzaldehyde dehydrogenase [NAD(+)] [Pannonibacter phragmitetus]|uniref:Benzaldehyde dehydrogenase [NAD(+)] n=1 Tax=Pannonibacter phragmitetus TaxID=121719 RepID=A0A378ZWU9_9HYPH|nr:benzaldehyde dehydrogenase [Pannonibacter phragmitetus]SUB01339.1 Benzaldehyde dehydrogenase [NAD(+)] [Pannonibacter phragmitetus]